MYLCVLSVSIHIYVSMRAYTAVYIYTAMFILLALPGISCEILIGQYYLLPEAIQKGFPSHRSFMDREMVRSRAKSGITTKNLGHLPEVMLWHLVHTLLDFFFF